MGRKVLIKYSNGVYHVNGRTNNKEEFQIPMRDCWYIFGYYLKKVQKNYNIKIHAFTLMNNHFHLLCSTPDANLDEGLRYLMTMTSRGIGLASGKINHLYGGRYHWTYVKDMNSYAIVYKYVLRNPIRAGICKNLWEYRWCTNFSNHFTFKLDPCEFDDAIPKKSFYEWIGDTGGVDESLIKKSLKEPEFRAPIKRSNRKKINLDTYLDAVSTPKGE